MTIEWLRQRSWQDGGSAGQQVGKPVPGSRELDEPVSGGTDAKDQVAGMGGDLACKVAPEWTESSLLDGVNGGLRSEA